MQNQNSATNTKIMDFLSQQAKSDDKSTFQAGRFYGACESLCMAGIITAKQWQDLQDLADIHKFHG